MLSLLFAALVASPAAESEGLESAVDSYIRSERSGQIVAAEPRPGIHGSAWIYLWLAGIEVSSPDGSGGDGGPTVETEGDIFEELAGAFMFHGSVGEGKWNLHLELLYLDIEGDVTAGSLATSASTSGWLVDLYATYDALDTRDGAGKGFRVAPFAGISFLDLNFETTGTITSTDILFNSWDLLLGVSASGHFSEKWAVLFRGSAGGFGLSDTKLRIDLLLSVMFNPSPKVSILLGYRWVDLEVDRDFPLQTRTLELTVMGPILAVGVNF